MHPTLSTPPRPTWHRWCALTTLLLPLLAWAQPVEVWQQVIDELARREGVSGIEEMANRKLQNREQDEADK